MKKQILFIFLFITTLVYSQTIDYTSVTSTEPNQIKIEPLLEPFILEFINEALSRGIEDPMGDLLKLDSILIAGNMPRYLGVNSGKNIYINQFVLNDYLMARSVIFHELFHGVYNLEHCHVEGLDIMCESKPNKFTFAYFYDDTIWQKSLDKEFARIIQ